MSNLLFASKDFYQPVFDFMKESGFEVMAWVTINSKHFETDRTYLAAQDSRIFFHLPGKSMIVMISYSEYYHNEKFIFSSEVKPGLWYWSHWSGELLFNFDHMRMWGDLYTKACNELGYMNFETDSIKTPDHRSTFSGGKMFQAYGQSGYCMHFAQTTNDGFDILTALESFPWISKSYSDYFYHKFDELGVGGFSPKNTFTGSEKYFWEHFPIRRLREKVQRGNIFGHIE